MTTGLQTGTAKIYQFPLRGRFSPGVLPENQVAGLDEVCDAASGGSWYHQAAIRESEPALKS